MINNRTTVLGRLVIDQKHHIEVVETIAVREKGAAGDYISLGELESRVVTIQIVKTGNGVPIPEDEPVILFRGRDYLAVPLLKVYMQMCIDDDCTDYQRENMEVMIKRFEDYAETHTLKQPGSTRGK